MIRNFNIVPTQTYVNEDTLQREVDKLIKKLPDADVKYFVTWTKEGRCFPVFIGENAIQHGIHFKYNVVA